MRGIFRHIKIYIFRGILTIIPLAITILAIQVIYILVDRQIIGFVDSIIGIKIPGIGIILVLAFLYLVGLIASNFIGKRVFMFIEKVSEQIPIIKTTYKIGRQLSIALSVPEKQLLKGVVLVDYFRPGIYNVGFITGTVRDNATNEELCKVFVPTTPTPASGFLILVKKSETIDPGWSVEDALKIVISGGLIGPEHIR